MQDRGALPTDESDVERTLCDERGACFHQQKALIEEERRKIRGLRGRLQSGERRKEDVGEERNKMVCVKRRSFGFSLAEVFDIF